MNFIFESLLKKLIIASKQRVIVPFYHKVSDEESTFEKYLYSSRKVLDFKKDIAVLSNYYSPISMQEFIEISKINDKIKSKLFSFNF